MSYDREQQEEAAVLAAEVAAIWLAAFERAGFARDVALPLVCAHISHPSPSPPEFFEAMTKQSLLAEKLLAE